MVAQRFLVPFVGVQIPVGLPILRRFDFDRSAFFFVWYCYGEWPGFSPTVFRFATRPVLSSALQTRNKSLSACQF